MPSVRAAVPEDRSTIVGLLREYLPQLDAEKRYDWLYATNPHGRALTWIAEDDSGTAVGMTSFFLRRLWVDGGEALGALGGDGYVRPDCRGQGIGTLMHKASRKTLTSDQVTVMFGTPSLMNRGPLNRSGAHDISVVARYVRPLSLAGRGGGALGMLDPLLRISNPFGRLEPMVPDDDRVDRVWEAFVADQGGAGVFTWRDSAFYTWRFLRSPTGVQRPYVVTVRGAPVGCLVLQQLRDRTLVIDLMTTTRHVGACLGAATRASNGSTALEMQLSDAHWLSRRAWRHGFLQRDRSKVLNIMLAPDSGEQAVYYDPTRWYFTWLESDMDFLD